jgi:hypothetical protein
MSRCGGNLADLVFLVLFPKFEERGPHLTFFSLDLDTMVSALVYAGFLGTSMNPGVGR